MKSFLSSFSLPRNLQLIWLKFDRQSLTLKAILTMSIALVLLVVFWSLVIEGISKKAIAETSLTSALYKSQIVKTELLEMILEKDPQERDYVVFLEGVTARQNLDTVNLYDPEGNVLFSSRPGLRGAKVDLIPEAKERRMLDDGFAQMVSDENGDRLRIVHSLILNGKPLGGVEIFIRLKDIYQHFVINRTLIFSGAVLIGLFGVLLISWLVQRIVKRPIKKLMSVMDRAARGEMHTRARIYEDPDLRKLAIRYGAMVRSIERAQKKIQEQYQRELSQANRLASLGQYISNISHEIKNPLAGISAALQAMGREASKEENEIFGEVRTKLDAIKQTVNNLLRYARQAPPSFQPCAVAVPIRKAMAYVHHGVHQQRIRVSIHVSKELPSIPADEGQLEQVFLNLFLNAVHAMPEGGMLKVNAYSAGEVLEEGGEHPGVMIEIEDSGSGIDSFLQEKIFEPFFSTKKEGTGLGLSVVKGIVEHHHGKIRLESKKGRGTKFFLWLPLGRQDRIREPAVSFNSPIAAGSMR